MISVLLLFFCLESRVFTPIKVNFAFSRKMQTNGEWTKENNPHRIENKRVLTLKCIVERKVFTYIQNGRKLIVQYIVACIMSKLVRVSNK